MASAKYKISESDYVNALKLSCKPTARRLIVLLILGGTLLGMAALGSSGIQAAGIGGLIGFVIVVVVNYLLLVPVLAKRNYRKYKAIHEEFDAELTDDGIKLSSRNGNWIVRLDQMQKWRENEKYILIYPMPRLFHIIPKNLETQVFNVNLLRERLIKHLGRQM